MRPLLDLLALALDSRDREAVLGDLRELGTPEPRACLEVVGLIARRQLASWRRVSAWCGLLALIVPTCLLLSYVSRWWADSAAIPAYFYVSNWTTAYLESPGARQDLFDAVRTVSDQGVALVVWSAIFGYAVGLHYRTASLSAALLALALIAAGSLGTVTTAHLFGGNQVVFADPVCGFLLPAVVRVGLVMIPAAVAIAYGARHAAPRLPASLCCAAGATLLLVVLRRDVVGAFTFGSGRLPGAGPDGVVGTMDDLPPAPWLACGLLLPAIWLVAHSLRRPAHRTVPVQP